MRRTYGNGSLGQRADGLWIAARDLPRGPDGRRRRKVFAAKTAEAAQAKLDSWCTKEGIAPRSACERPSRAKHMEHARSIATHTEAEWRDKVAAYGGLCHYCARPRLWVLHKDHMTPVSRGGSDGIENVVPACADCNSAKSSMTAAEFQEHARLTGLFSMPRKAQVAFGGRIIRMDQEKAARMRRDAWRQSRPLLMVGVEK